MERRTLNFHSANEVVAEIERLQQGGYEKLKKWNLTQICDHIGETTRLGMEGSSFRMPWLFRVTFGKWFLRGVLKDRKMRAGTPTAKVLEPKPAEHDNPEVVAQCIETYRRAAEFSGPLPPHPLVDNLTLEDWKELTWIHAAHHLGFLIPKDQEPTTNPETAAAVES